MVTVRWLVLGLVGWLLAATAHAYTVWVSTVSDGDTLSVMHGVQTERIRLFGIDAPEKSQPYGSRAKAELARLCLGRTAQIAVRDHDRHGRIVAQVFCGGQDAALHLLQRGLAWVYVQYRPPAQYLQAEQTARQSKAGLWADANPTPPWEWRHAATH